MRMWPSGLGTCLPSRTRGFDPRYPLCGVTSGRRRENHGGAQGEGRRDVASLNRVFMRTRVRVPRGTSQRRRHPESLAASGRIRLWTGGAPGPMRR